jgi:capsular polysaccharide biosynthesis protein
LKAVELKGYWTIIWRRLWIVAVVVIIAGAYSGYQYYKLRKTPGALTAYSSSITIQVGLQATSGGTDPSYADDVAVSEVLADTLISSPLLSSKEFDTQVSSQVGADTSAIQQKFNAGPDGPWQDAGAIGGAISAVRSHNLVTITVTWPTSVGAWAVANAIGEVSSTNLCNYLEYVVSKSASCSASTTGGDQPAVSAQVISGASDPAPVPGTSVNKETLLFILMAVALIVGIALAFLVDYLDDRIFTKDDAVALLQVPVVGEVPRAPAVGQKGQSARQPSPVA